MKRPKNNALYWLFKALSVLVSCGFPLWAIYERFPVWVGNHGRTHSIGTGGILMFFVVIVTFRKQVFAFFREKLRLKHAPPVFVSFIFMVIGYVLEYISKFLTDITSVFEAWFIGCLIGTALTFVAENFLRVGGLDNG